MAVLCYCCVSMAQQVISSGGYEVKSEVSVNWILGGSLSDIAPIDPNVLNKLRKDEMMESRVRNGILDLTGIEILPKFVISDISYIPDNDYNIISAYQRSIQ